MRLTLITNPESEENDGELIHYGSPRLHQIFQTSKELGSYIRLYEEVRHSGATHTPLHPWLGVNIKFPINVIEKRYPPLHRHSSYFWYNDCKLS